MLPMTSGIIKLIEAGAGETMVRQQARSEGAHTILEDAVEKLRAGITTVEEIQRVVQIVDGETTQCPGCQKEIAEDYSVCPHCSKVLHASCGGCAKPLNPEWVRCPYCGAAAVADETPAAAAPAERRSFKALVVDDTSTIRDVVQHTLEHSDLGLTVLTAENGPEALELAGRERPDIVILDIMMPGMDGFEVCRRLRSEMRTAFVPVLMLTAHDSEDDVARGFGVGADDYMVKPFRREGLVARVRRILERTYGSQAIGAAPLPDTASAPPVGATDSAATFATGSVGVDVGARLAELLADRDALKSAVASCEARLTELAARPGASDGAARANGLDATAFDELRTLVADLRSAQEQRFDVLRADAQRALTMAEEALASVHASAAAAPPADFRADLAAMASTVERLQGEQASFRSALDAARADDGADEECERRLRQASVEIEELRTGVTAMQATWQSELQALRSDTRTVADEAAERVQNETASALARMTQSLGGLQSDLATQREELSRESGRVRAAEAQTGRVQDEALAATERVSRELAALQRTLAEHHDQRQREAEQQQQDAKRLVSVEEAARRTRAEAEAVADQMRDELGSLRRALGARPDGASPEELAAVRSQVERLAGTAAGVQDVRAEITALADRTAQDLAELRRLIAMQQEIQSATGMDAQASEAAWQNLQREAVAAAEAAARALQGEAIAAAEGIARTAQAEAQSATATAIAAAERTAEGLAELRETVVAQHGVQQEELASLQSRLGQARRAAVKLVRRVRVVGRTLEAKAREGDCERQLAAMRDETLAALAGVHQEHAALAQGVSERLKDLPSAAEHRTVMAFLDGCETQLTEFAARLDAQGATRTASEDEARQHLTAELQELKGVVARLDDTHRRHAADIEERLRGLMRTAAGGFDVQLALLRGKVEVLARTLRDQVPVDPTPNGDALLQHRQGLLEMLREQLTSLQSGTEWRPQRVLDLLIESTLAAAITPFRRMLQLAQGEESPTPELPPADDHGASGATDESASPS